MLGRGRLHESQYDLGLTSDCDSGSLSATTFMKLPTDAPTANANTPQITLPLRNMGYYVISGAIVTAKRRITAPRSVLEVRSGPYVRMLAAGGPKRFLNDGQLVLSDTQMNRSSSHPPALTVLGKSPNPCQRGSRPSPRGARDLRLDSPAGQLKTGVTKD